MVWKMYCSDNERLVYPSFFIRKRVSKKKSTRKIVADQWNSTSYESSRSEGLCGKGVVLTVDSRGRVVYRIDNATIVRDVEASVSTTGR